MARATKLVAFEAYDDEIRKLMGLLRDLHVKIPDNADLLSDELMAFQFLYYAVFADERPANLDPNLAKVQAGLGDLATKINKAWAEPNSESLPACNPDRILRYAHAGGRQRISKGEQHHVHR